MPDDKEEIALTLAGEKKKIKREHFITLGVKLGLTEKQILSAFNRMLKKKPVAIKWINASFLSAELKENYKKIIDTKYKQLKIVAL